MSYTEYKEGIKLDVLSQINRYKNGTAKEKKIAEKIEELTNQIQCFQCLDTKQAWYFRQEDHRLDGHGDFYKMTCAICPDKSIRDNWIENSLTNEIYGISDIKLFSKVNYSGAERFKELEKLALKRYPELLGEEPTYKKTEKNIISVKKKTTNLKLEIGNIINKCQQTFRAYSGDVTALISLLDNIVLHISNCENQNKQEHILCEEIEFKNFMYIKISNNSITKKKSILGLYEYNKYKLDIEISIFVLNPDNSSAYNKCRQIVNKLAMNDIDDVNEIFLSIEKEK
jgi:hypothetical protein